MSMSIRVSDQCFLGNEVWMVVPECIVGKFDRPSGNAKYSFMEYKVSSHGRLWLSHLDREALYHYDRDGYKMISINKHKMAIHRLMMICFCPIQNYRDMVVNHIDGNKTNNTLINLEWCDNQANQLHANVNGMMDFNIGSNCKFANVVEREIDYVCQLLESNYLGQTNYQPVEISKLTGVSRDTIRHVKEGNCWKQISSNYEFSKSFKKANTALATNDWNQVCSMAEQGYTTAQISLETNIHERNIRDLKAGNIYVMISKDYNIQVPAVDNLLMNQIHQVCQYATNAIMIDYELLANQFGKSCTPNFIKAIDDIIDENKCKKINAHYISMVKESKDGNK